MMFKNENDDAIASVHANISKPTLKSVHACKDPAPVNLKKKKTQMVHVLACKEMHAPNELYEHIDYYERASNECAPPPLNNRKPLLRSSR